MNESYNANYEFREIYMDTQFSTDEKKCMEPEEIASLNQSEEI